MSSIHNCPKCIEFAKSKEYMQKKRQCETVADDISLLEEVAEKHDNEHHDENI